VKVSITGLEIVR